MPSVFKRGQKRLSKRQLEREPYVYEYIDERGRVRRRTGTLDKDQTTKIAFAAQSRADQIREGLIDPSAEKLAGHRSTPIEKHMTEFIASISGGTNTEKYVKLIRTRLSKIIARSVVQSLSDINEVTIESAIQAIRLEKDLGLKTYNHYLQAIDEFCRWLVRANRLPANPVAGIRRLNTEVDVRHKRRSLDPDEFDRLLTAARKSTKRVQGYSGKQRVRAYLMSYWTGLRQKELASLTRASFDLDNDPPTVTIAAAHAKNRRTDVIPLPVEAAAIIRTWLDDIDSKELLFPRFDRKKAWLMVRKDLEAAGIPYETEYGIADFHAVGRASHITELLRSGVDVATAMKQARHSDVKLTLKYFKGNMSDKTQAVSKLPMPASASQCIVSERPRPECLAVSSDGPNSASEDEENGAGSPFVDSLYGSERTSLSPDDLGQEKVEAAGIEPASYFPQVLYQVAI